MSRKVSVSIPARDKVNSIGDLITRIKASLSTHGVIIIVVDDGSYDGTSEAAQVAEALVINHGANKGYEESTKSCFEGAKANATDVLVILDGDGQHNPDELPQVLALIIKGEADLVIGSRFLSSRTNMPRYRKFGIDVITFLYNFRSRVKVSDAQSDLRAYNKKIFAAHPLSEKGMSISVEVIIKAREKGLSIKEVPISCLYHSQSSSLNPVVHGLGVALTVVKLRSKSLLGKLLKNSGAKEEGLYK